MAFRETFRSTLQGLARSIGSGATVTVILDTVTKAPQDQNLLAGAGVLLATALTAFVLRIQASKRAASSPELVARINIRDWLLNLFEYWTQAKNYAGWRETIKEHMDYAGDYNDNELKASLLDISLRLATMQDFPQSPTVGETPIRQSILGTLLASDNPPDDLLRPAMLDIVDSRHLRALLSQEISVRSGLASEALKSLLSCEDWSDGNLPGKLSDSDVELLRASIDVLLQKEGTSLEEALRAVPSQQDPLPWDVLVDAVSEQGQALDAVLRAALGREAVPFEEALIRAMHATRVSDYSTPPKAVAKPRKFLFRK